MLLILLVVYGPGLFRTPSEERVPGPLVVWMISEPEAKDKFQYFGDLFEENTGIDLELEFKETWELRPLLEDRSERIEGKVDVVEVDMVDMARDAPFMEDMSGVFNEMGRLSMFYSPALDAGIFEGRQAYLPWRLSWPLMMVSHDVDKELLSWTYMERIVTSRDSGEFLLPALNDRELFLIMTSIIHAKGGDPTNATHYSIRESFEFLDKIADKLDTRSSYTSSMGISEISQKNRPMISFAWPDSLEPLILDASIPLYYDAQPMPCGLKRKCGVAFTARFFAIPSNAPHKEDAYAFLEFMTSVEIQTRMIFATPWLPVRKDGWGDLGSRQKSYGAFQRSARNLVPPPVEKMDAYESALAETARMVLFQGAEPEEAAKKYAELAPAPEARPADATSP